MNVSQLRTFVTVVEAGSFSEAARALGISQPAVTMQVQSLESDVGATLLDRRYRRVDLTEAGRTLLPHARRVLAQIDSAKEEIVALSGAVTGRLTIAASTTPGVYVIPRLMGAFLSSFPEVGIRILVHDTSEVVAMVESGEAHIGLTGATVRGARVTYQESGADDLVLICPPQHPLATREKVALTDLADETWIMRESGSGTRQVAERILTEHGLDTEELRVAVELGTGEAIVSAVEGGLGVSILSRMVAGKAIELGTVIQVDAVGLPAARPFYLVMPKGTPTRAAVAFHQYLTDTPARS
ncbi:MAG: LysR family transcriptional regulator [Actinobacteria bacterium HGW-Actinobacteria-7]|jgi:DNA-binding transcriptional LysR family regulator|nr:MAG: LysR family transcriptional regulator [Actinobacteria bacterium HGW-Actinobacteria-7]